MKMTPNEIVDYKRSWMNTATEVRLHSDLRLHGIEWCKGHCEQWEFNFTLWTGHYEHTFAFEDANTAREFKDRFGEFADQ